MIHCWHWGWDRKLFHMLTAVAGLLSRAAELLYNDLLANEDV